MISTPIQSVQQGFQHAENIQGHPAVNNNQSSANPNKSYLEEQSLAITFDISGEYSAISRMNSLIADITNEIKATTDPERKKLLEARVNTLHTMILQREARINQMEMCKTQIDRQAVA